MKKPKRLPWGPGPSYRWDEPLSLLLWRLAQAKGDLPVAGSLTSSRGVRYTLIDTPLGEEDWDQWVPEVPWSSVPEVYQKALEAGPAFILIETSAGLVMGTPHEEGSLCTWDAICKAASA